jgi:hypothetical protein
VHQAFFVVWLLGFGVTNKANGYWRIWKMNSILLAVMMIGFVGFLAYLAYDTWLDVKKNKAG